MVSTPTEKSATAIRFTGLVRLAKSMVENDTSLSRTPDIDLAVALRNAPLNKKEGSPDTFMFNTPILTKKEIASYSSFSGKIFVGTPVG